MLLTSKQRARSCRRGQHHKAKTKVSRRHSLVLIGYLAFMLTSQFINPLNGQSAGENVCLSTAAGGLATSTSWSNYNSGYPNPNDVLNDGVCGMEGGSNGNVGFAIVTASSSRWWVGITFPQKFVIRTVLTLDGRAGNGSMTELYMIAGNTVGDDSYGLVCATGYNYSRLQSCPNNFDILQLVIRSTQDGQAYFGEVKAFREINLGDPVYTSYAVGRNGWWSSNQSYTGCLYNNIEQDLGGQPTGNQCVTSALSSAYYELQFTTPVRVAAISYRGRADAIYQGMNVKIYMKDETSSSTLNYCNGGTVYNSQPSTGRGMCMDVPCGMVGQVIGLQRQSNDHLSIAAFAVLECLTTGHTVSDPGAQIYYLNSAITPISVTTSLTTDCTSLNNYSVIDFTITDSSSNLIYDSTTSTPTAWISSVDNNIIYVSSTTQADVGIYQVSYTSTLNIYSDNTDTASNVVTGNTFPIEIQCNLPNSAIDKPVVTTAASYQLWTAFQLTYTDRTNNDSCTLVNYIKKASDNSEVWNSSTSSTETTTFPEISLDSTAFTIDGYTQYWSQLGAGPYNLYLEQCLSGDTQCFQSDTFTITFTDPCTPIVSQSLSSIYVHVDSQPITQETFTDYQDNAQLNSLAYYPSAFTTQGCGTRSYQILDSTYSAGGVPSYLTEQVASAPYYLQVSTSNPADYTNGIYVQYYLRVTITNLDSVSTYIDDGFLVQVDDCIVTYLNAPAVTTQDYNVYTPTSTISFSQFYQDNGDDNDFSNEIICNYPVTYTAEYSTDGGINYNPSIVLPFLSFSDSLLQLTLQTNDPGLVQTYHVKITGSLSSTDQAAPLSQTLIITQVVANGCQNDQVTLLVGLSSGITVYEISESSYPTSAIDFYPIWANSVTGCPQTWSLYKIDSGSEVAYDTNAFTINTSTSGKVSLQTDDTVTYEPPQTLTMRIYQTSDYSTDSNNRNSVDFQVEIRNRCYTGSSTVPSASSSYTFDLYDAQTTPATVFTAMTHSLPDCGNIVHVIQWAQTYSAIGATADADTTWAITESGPYWTWAPSDQNYVGTWQVYIKGYLQSFPTITTKSTDFSVALTNPCTSIISQTISNIVIDVHGTNTASTTFIEFSDQASIDYQSDQGTSDTYSLCGTRTYSLVDSSGNPASNTDPLSLSGTTITLSTTDPVYYSGGAYKTYYVRVALQYAEPSTYYYDNSFQIKIDACQIGSFGTTALGVINYNIYTQAKTQLFSAFTQVSDSCGYFVTYTATIASNGNALDSSLMTYSAPTLASQTDPIQIIIQTDDPSKEAIYTVRLTGEVALTDMNPNNIISNYYIDYTINVANNCLTDVVSLSSVTYDEPSGSPVAYTQGTNVVYYIEDGQHDFSPVWTESVVGCPLEHSLLIEDSNGSYVDYTTDTLYSNLFSIDTGAAPIAFDTTAGKVSFSTSDYSYDLMVFKGKIRRQSQQAQFSSGTNDVLFEATIKDRCWDAVLFPSSPASEFVTYNLWAAESLSFDAMSDLPPINSDTTCESQWAPHSYSLEYVSGGLSSSLQTSLLNSYTISGLSISAAAGNVNLLDYVEGTHVIKVVGKNANKYNSVDVKQFQIVYTNPCLTTGIVPQSISAMEVTVHGTQEEQQFSQFTDTVSSNNGGNGYNYCGSRTHYVRLPDGSNVSYMEERGLKLTLYTEDSSLVGDHQVYLWCQLTGYPAITGHAIVAVTIKPCVMLQWSLANQIYDSSYVVGDDRVYFTYDLIQSPCDYNQSYTVFLEDGSPLPDFIEFSTGSPSITVYTNDANDEGVYRMIVQAQLDDEIQSTQSFNFVLRVEATAAEYTTLGNTAPYFAVIPSDQTVKFGDSMNYELGPALDVEDDNVQVTVSYEGGIESLMSYTESNNLFSIPKDYTGRQDQGSYKVKMTLTDDNEDYGSKSTEYEFLIKIIENPDWVDPDEEVYEPPDYKQIDYEWSQYNFTDLTDTATQQVNPADPVPRIIDLDYAGVLTIAFDKKMQIPSTFQSIPDQKVAVLEDPQSEVDSGVVATNQQIDQSDLSPDSLLRMLQTNTEELDLSEEQFQQIDIKPLLELKVLPSDSQIAQNVEFSWSVKAYYEDYVELQLDFIYPESISEQTDEDQLIVTFFGNDDFQSVDGNGVAPGTTLRKPIVRQISVSSAQSAENAGNICKAIFTTLFITCFIVVAIAGRSLLPFWSVIDTLSLILHTPLFSVIISAKTAIFLKIMLQLPNLQFLPIMRRPRENWGFDIQPSFNEKFEQYGYLSPYVTPNLSFILVLIQISLIIWILVAFKDLILYKFNCQSKIKSDRVRKILTWVSEKDMCNFNIRLFIQVFFEICVCTFVNLAKLSSESQLSTVYSFIFLTAIILFTLFVFSRLFIDKPKWNKEETQVNPRFRTIYAGLYLKYINAAIMYPSWYLLRRILYALILVTMTGNALGQVFLYMLMSGCMIVVLWKYKPFEHRKSLHKLQLFNEFCVLMSGAILTTQSFILINKDQRQRAGDYLVALVVFLLVVNTIYQVQHAAYSGGWWLKKQSWTQIIVKLKGIFNNDGRKADETKLPQVDIEVNEPEVLPEDLIMFQKGPVSKINNIDALHQKNIESQLNNQTVDQSAISNLDVSQDQFFNKHDSDNTQNLSQKINKIKASQDQDDDFEAYLAKHEENDLVNELQDEMSQTAQEFNRFMRKKTKMYEEQKRQAAATSDISKSIDLNSISKLSRDLTPRTASQLNKSPSYSSSKRVIQQSAQEIINTTPRKHLVDQSDQGFQIDTRDESYSKDDDEHAKFKKMMTNMTKKWQARDQENNNLE